MTEVNPSEFEAGRWIKRVVEEATGLEAYLDVVPADQQPPAIKFQCQVRGDTRTNAQHIAVSTWRFLVVGMTFTHDVDAAATIAKQIDQALHRAKGSTDELQILACTRVQTYGQTSPEQGGLYRLGGAVYEIVGASAVGP